MSHTFTAEHPAHPDYPYSPEALHERVFFSQLNDNHDRIGDWNKRRANSYDKKIDNSDPRSSSDKENSKITNVTRQPDANHILSKNVFDIVTPDLKQQMLNYIQNPKPKLPRGGRKRTRVFRKNSKKRFTSKSSRHTRKSSRRTSRKYK